MTATDGSSAATDETGAEGVAAAKVFANPDELLSAVGTNEGIELLLNRIAKTESNAEFLAKLTKSAETDR